MQVDVVVPVDIDDWMCELTLADFAQTNPIDHGHTDDLYHYHFKNGVGYKVWLSRMKVEDGMPYDNAVTVEKYIANRWVEVLMYEAI